MKKLSKAKKAVLMLTMLLSLTAAFANDVSSNSVGNFFDKMFGITCQTLMTGDEQCCRHTFWVSHSCFTP
jgi:hypothetical protein